MGIFKRSNLAELIFGQKWVSGFADLVNHGLVQVYQIDYRIISLLGDLCHQASNLYRTPKRI